MTTPLVQLFEALQIPLRGLLCTALPQAVDRALINLVAPVVGASLAPDLINWLQPATCAAPPPQDANPGLLGGQCQAIYLIQSAATLADGTTQAINWGPQPGPIVGIRMTWQVNPFFNTQRALPQILVTDATQPGGVRIEGFGPIGPEDPNRVARHYFTSIVRQDGLPDNCGDRPPAPPNPPPSYPELPIPPFNVTVNGTNITINGFATFAPAVNIPIYGGIHIPVTVRIQPTISIPGGVRIPVYLQLPSLTINPQISGIELDLENVIDFPSGGDIEIPFVERLIGVNVQSAIEPDSPVTIVTGREGAPNLYVPRLAVVRFTSPAFAGSRQSNDIDVKSANQFVPVPWFYGADAFTILPQTGVTCVTSEVRAQIADLVKSV